MTEPFSVKYLKKLFGSKTHVEDALKRLGVLTQLEAQMAAAQVDVDDTQAGRIRGVANIAPSVDDRVAGVGGQVQVVNNNVTAAMDGA